MKTKALAGALASLVLTPALAFEAGDWLVRAGITNVDPKDDNNPIVSVDAGAAVNLNVTYLFTANWAVDVLAAIPFNHEIDFVDGPTVGETSQLPPTVSLQYRFRPEARFQPYVGVGVNYTFFFDEETTGPLAGSDLELDDSVGLAAQVGFDMLIDDNWFWNLDARWMNIETEATVNSAPLGDVVIDPWVYGISVGYRF